MATDAEGPTIAFAFASVVATRNILKGETLSSKNIFPMRPAGGDFGPVDYEGLLGKRASRDIEGGFQLKRESVE